LPWECAQILTFLYISLRLLFLEKKQKKQKQLFSTYPKKKKKKRNGCYFPWELHAKEAVGQLGCLIFSILLQVDSSWGLHATANASSTHKKYVRKLKIGVTSVRFWFIRCLLFIYKKNN
jgi:preprotein translocase subunit SecG